MNIFEKLYTDQVFDGINNITRWNNSRRIKDETVAQHSYLVTLFANFLVERLCEDLHSVKDRTEGYGYFKMQDFKLKVLRASLMHDFDEITSGDILYTVKNNEFNGFELTKALDKFVEYKVQNLLKDVKESERTLFIESTNYYKDKTIKGVVKICDWLACLFYIYKEKQLGNTSFNDRLEICKVEGLKWIETTELNLLSRLDFGFQKKDLIVLEELKELINNLKNG